MSISANTAERMTIHNVNDETAVIAKELGEYLLKTWGIDKLRLKVDGVSYGDNVDFAIEKGSELCKVCENLAQAREIELYMLSTNGGGAAWRLDSCFMKDLSDDEDLKNNIVYRSTDYYDTDPYIDRYLYDGNGLQTPEYINTADDVANIKMWFCNTPALRIEDEDKCGDDVLYNSLVRILRKLCAECFGMDEEDIENQLIDEWKECGSISLFGSLFFSTESIPKIHGLLSKLFDLAKASDVANAECEVYAVPDGEGDYDFASIGFTYDGEKVKTEYCRF